MAGKGFCIHVSEYRFGLGRGIHRVGRIVAMAEAQGMAEFVPQGVANAGVCIASAKGLQVDGDKKLVGSSLEKARGVKSCNDTFSQGPEGIRQPPLPHSRPASRRNT